MKVGERIYCDYQATTPIDSRVKCVMNQAIDNYWGNPHSIDHIWGWESAKAIESAVLQINSGLNLGSSELIFTSGATEANNLAILGFARSINKNKEKRLTVVSTEHKAVLETAFELRENEGFKLDVVDVDEKGFLREDLLRASLQNGSSFVSVMVVNNEIGTIQNVKLVSEICREFGAFFHCDAAQGFGDKDAFIASLDVADAISISAHKVYGPKGVGALILKQDRLSQIKPLMFGGAQQNGLRPGTIPVCQILGFCEALQIWIKESDQELIKIRALSNLFLKELTKKGIEFKLNGAEFPLRHAGNINIAICGINNHELLGMLQPKIAASTGSACNSGIPGPSHVLTSIGLSQEQAESSIRFSFGRFTDERQVEEITNQISDCISILL